MPSTPGNPVIDSGGCKRQKIKVTIYQRVKRGTKWGRKRVTIPSLKIDGMLFLKDDRRGIFQLCWHENRQKRWQNFKGRVNQLEVARRAPTICAHAA
jgi:hypothetical protein